MKILFLDIETAPNIAHVWGLWQQNVGLPQLIDSSYVMCFAAKWLNDDKIIFSSVEHTHPKRMLLKIWDLLEEADAVVHYNGTKFDIPTLNKEFLLHDLTPPAPYKQIDLLRVARSQFKFPSNKLDYVSNALGLGKKTKHIGHELWIQCMANNPEAWKMMEEYNIQDVILLEKVYGKLKPWIKNHPNQNLFSNGEHVCPNCGGKHLHKRGTSHTIAGQYQRYKCTACGTWSRDVKKINGTLGITGAA
jgi:uncharacterized protein YprB with RNaseH-like and TPR domain/predicted RNA-binding Zn-ribbon protein involved in translation (DUF1610 family)